MKINKSLLIAGLERYQKYQDWLRKQPLAENSKRAYLSRINHFLVFLAGSDVYDKDVFKDARERDYILKDYKRYLRLTLKMQPTSVNAALTAIDHFYHFLGFNRTTVQKEALPRLAPQSLSAADQHRLLRAIERMRRAKDRAIAMLLFHTGIRISECAALDFDDVYVAGRKHRVIIRNGKGERYREVPLNTEVSEAIRAWLQERCKREMKMELSAALFVNPQGKRMTTAALGLVVRKIGRDCGMEISPHLLRHICITNLVRAGNDIVLVAEIAGHMRLETTRRYSLPTLEDKERAMESLQDI